MPKSCQGTITLVGESDVQFDFDCDTGFVSCSIERGQLMPEPRSPSEQRTHKLLKQLVKITAVQRVEITERCITLTVHPNIHREQVASVASNKVHRHFNGLFGLMSIVTLTRDYRTIVFA